jgi:hypothetical protein
VAKWSTTCGNALAAGTRLHIDDHHTGYYNTPLVQVSDCFRS